VNSDKTNLILVIYFGQHKQQASKQLIKQTSCLSTWCTHCSQDHMRPSVMCDIIWSM